jgi:cysteine sulfinate desulfinase/cysteine desulfurase-like protein
LLSTLLESQRRAARRVNEALGSLRLTTGYATTDEEVSRARAIISSVLTRSGARA